MIITILRRMPGGDGFKVFVGTMMVLGLGMAPVAYKKTKAGHDYFSSEKPEEVREMVEAKEKQKYSKIVERG